METDIEDLERQVYEFLNRCAEIKRNLDEK